MYASMYVCMYVCITTITGIFVPFLEKKEGDIKLSLGSRAEGVVSILDK